MIDYAREWRQVATVREARADVVEAEEHLSFLDAAAEEHTVPASAWREAEDRLYNAELVLASFPTCPDCLEKIDFDATFCPCAAGAGMGE